MTHAAPVDRRGAAWRYRCFTILPIKGGWKAANVLKFLSHEIPRSFRWTNKEDQEGLRNYVDMVTGGRKSEWMAVEERGLVTDKEMDPEELSGSVTVDLGTLLDVLATGAQVDIPLKQKISFVTNGRTLVPAEFIAILAQYAKRPSMLGDPQEWTWAKPADIERLAPGPNGITSGMNRGRSFMDGPDDAELPSYDPEEGDDAPIDTAPQESEIRRSPYDRYFELVTVAAPRRGKPYYVRRLARYHGQLLWSGSSYGPNGPWTEYARDNAQLLALGLTP